MPSEKISIILLLIALLLATASCQPGDSDGQGADSGGIGITDLIAVQSTAWQKTETSVVDLSSNLRNFYLASGWAEPTSGMQDVNLEEAIGVARQAVLRIQVLRPGPRWLAFSARSIGKYGGPEQQRVEVFLREERLAELDISGEQDKEYTVEIPEELAPAGKNNIRFKFAVREENPNYLKGRSKRKAGRKRQRDNPYPFITGYFSNFRIVVDPRQTSDPSANASEGLIRLAAGGRALLQRPNSEISFGKRLREETTLDFEGELVFPQNARESLSAVIRYRTDDDRDWREIWKKEISTQNTSQPLPFSGSLTLGPFAGEPVEINLAVYSTAFKPEAAVIWKRLNLESSGNPPADTAGPGVNRPRIPGNLKHLVIIIFDAMRPDFLGCYGNSEGLTPNMDSFAESALVFNNAVTAAPYTIASVSTIFSGLLPERHGVQNNRSVFPDELESMPKAFKRKGYYTLAMAGLPFVTRKFGITREFDEVVYLRREEDVKEERSVMNLELMRSSIEEARRTGKPAFIYIHLLPPHYPYNPPAPFNTKFTGAEKHTYVDRRFTRLMLSNREITAQHPAVIEHMRYYKNNLAYADYLLSQLLDILRDSGLYGESLILLAADHAEAFGEHGRIGHNSTVYDDMIKVPFIVSYPGIKPGIENQQVGLVDVFPTVAELFGLELQGGQLDGRSILPLILGEIQEPSDYYYSRASDRFVKFSLRDARLKYIHNNFEDELYDLLRDPGEKNNIAAAFPALVATLRQKGMAIVESEPFFESTRRVKLSKESEEELKNLGYIQ